MFASRKEPSATFEEDEIFFPLSFCSDGGDFKLNLNFCDLRFPLRILDSFLFIPSSCELSNIPFMVENTSILSVFISDVLSASAVLLKSKLQPSSFCSEDSTCTGGENVN